MSEAQYIDHLENLANQKTAEADDLMSRLLRHRHHGVAAGQQLEGAKEIRGRNADLAAENRRLKGELARLRAQVAQYVVRRREARADQRTRELQELAELRGQTETHNAELYPFVLSQLGQFADGQYSLDATSVRGIVARAAASLRSAAGRTR
jgi:ribosomal protein L29